MSFLGLFGSGKARALAAAMAAVIASGVFSAVPASATAVCAEGFASEAGRAAAAEGLVSEAGKNGAAARSHKERDRETDDSFFLLPDSNTYYITESDVSWMDDEQLLIARNEFYARRGRKFVTAFLREYFNSQDWYYGYIEPDDFSNDLFNRYEQANVDFIVKYEEKRSAKKEEEERRRRKEKKARREKSALRDSNPTGEDHVAYGELVDDYCDALKELFAHRKDSWPGGMSALASNMEAPEDLGYAFRDLDGDGREELFIGPMDARLYGEGAVFEIYTMEDDEPVRVASSMEDGLYYICDDNTVCRERVFDDGSWEIGYFNFEDGALEFDSALVMDEKLNREEPWFLADDSSGLYGDMTKLADSPEDAMGGGRLADGPEEAMDGEGLADGPEDAMDGGRLAHSPEEAMRGRKPARASEEDVENGELEGSIADALGPEAFESISYEEASELRASHAAAPLGLQPFD